MSQILRELDTVVLTHDLPEAGLCAGDLGAVVQLYPNNGIEVEFVTAAGRTQALLTLRDTDVRAVQDDDLLAVRVARYGGNSPAITVVRTLQQRCCRFASTSSLLGSDLPICP